MGIANVVNMASHLRNASKARLGITSVPNTKYNLSVALALHRALAGAETAEKSEHDPEGNEPPAPPAPHALARRRSATRGA